LINGCLIRFQVDFDAGGTATGMGLLKGRFKVVNSGVVVFAIESIP